MNLRVGRSTRQRCIMSEAVEVAWYKLFSTHVLLLFDYIFPAAYSDLLPSCILSYLLKNIIYYVSAAAYCERERIPRLDGIGKHTSNRLET